MLNDTESVVVTASNANLSYQRDIGQNVTGKLSEYRELPSQYLKLLTSMPAPEREIDVLVAKW